MNLSDLSTPEKIAKTIEEVGGYVSASGKIYAIRTSTKPQYELPHSCGYVIVFSLIDESIILVDKESGQSWPITKEQATRLLMLAVPSYLGAKQLLVEITKCSAPVA